MHVQVPADVPESDPEHRRARERTETDTLEQPKGHLETVRRETIHRDFRRGRPLP